MFNKLQNAQSNDILRFIIQSGKIDIGDVEKSMEAMKRKELLEKHLYEIGREKAKSGIHICQMKRREERRESGTVREELNRQILIVIMESLGVKVLNRLLMKTLVISSKSRFHKMI